MRIRGLCDAFGNKLPIAAYCSHSQANGDQGDFDETYAARPDCFQDTFYNNILTSKISVSPWGTPPPLPCVQYIDPEVPLLHLTRTGGRKNTIMASIQLLIQIDDTWMPALSISVADCNRFSLRPAAPFWVMRFMDASVTYIPAQEAVLSTTS